MILVDGYTRVGKDYLIDNELIYRFPSYNVVRSNHDLADLSSKYSTNLLFFNLAIMINRIHLLHDAGSIINRSFLGDMSYTILVHVFDELKKHNSDEYLDKYIETYTGYMGEVLLRSEVWTEYSNIKESSIMLITSNQYDQSLYYKNLNSPKGHAHHDYLINRFSKSSYYLENCLFIRSVFNRIYRSLVDKLNLSANLIVLE